MFHSKVNLNVFIFKSYNLFLNNTIYTHTQSVNSVILQWTKEEQIQH